MAYDDNAYFRRRAEQELDLAQRATDGAVVCAHYHLAEAYLEKLGQTNPSAMDEALQHVVNKPLFDFPQDDEPL